MLEEVPCERVDDVFDVKQLPLDWVDELTWLVHLVVTAPLGDDTTRMLLLLPFVVDVMTIQQEAVLLAPLPLFTLTPDALSLDGPFTPGELLT